MGLRGESLNTRLQDLVTPYDIDYQGGYLLVTLNYALDFKAGEILALDDASAKGLKLTPFTHGEPLPPPLAFDPLAHDPLAPAPLTHKGDGETSDAGLDPLGEPLALPQIEGSEGESQNGDDN